MTATAPKFIDYGRGDNTDFGPRRYLALDGWRGICATLVAIMHFRTTGTIGTYSIVSHGHLFVDFFFLLSGFVLSHAYLDRLRSSSDAAFMMWRRLGRLWPLHLALLAAFIALELAGPIIELVTGLTRTATSAFDPDSSALLSAIPTNILLVQALGIHDRLTWNIPSWSISVEFWTYLVFALVAILCRGRTLLAAAMLSALGIVIVVQFSPAYMAAENGLGFFRCLSGFFAGHLVYRFMQSESVRLPFANLLEAAAAIGVIVFVAYGGGTRFEFAAPIIFGAIVWLFAQERGAISSFLKSRPLQLLGLWSYSIYMVHSLVIAIVHRGLTVLEQVTDQKLTLDVQAAAGLQHTLSFGGSYVMDLVTLLYIAVVITLSAITWRSIEMPAARYWNGTVWAAAKQRVAVSAAMAR